MNIVKGDFHFAVAQQIPFLLKELNNKYRSRYTPCHLMDDEVLIEAMAVQAGKPELDFTSWDAKKERYFLAIQAGMDCNYNPMMKLVSQALRDAANSEEC